jgi:hypothetical protein
MADRLTKIELKWCNVCDKQLGFESAVVENIANGLIVAERKDACENHPSDGSNVRVLTYMLPINERDSDGLSRAR